MATETESLRASGFKRILVRLDEATRRKYCCRALEEDLQRVVGQAGACEAAMKQAQQVQDATRRLEAGPRTAAVSTEVLNQLEALLGKLDDATNKLGGQDPAVKQEQDGKDQDKNQARTLVECILQDHHAEKASADVKRMEKLMPVRQDGDQKQVKWWKKHVQKAVDHAVTLALQDGAKAANAKLRLSRVVKRIAIKLPDLQDWSRTVEKKLGAPQKKKGKETAAETPAKSKRKRLIPLPDDGETARTEAPPATKKPTAEKEKKGESSDKARALLHRCSNEMRTLRVKFELGAYDVNLSRMVKLVDSLWPGIDQAEVNALTTALFTLVETVEKVVNVDKRRDRLVCLESVLGVVQLTDKLTLTVRQKTMVEEYAANCRQSLEQLNRKAQSGKQASTAATGQTSAPTPSPATAAARTPAPRPAQNTQTAWPKTHVRFG